MENRTINGWGFKYDEENKMYECRGSVMYDDDHDETPEPSLWRAAEKLEAELLSGGHSAEANYSEKGWVEVTIR
jgi:hypothetical protein